MMFNNDQQTPLTNNNFQNNLQQNYPFQQPQYNPPNQPQTNFQQGVQIPQANIAYNPNAQHQFGNYNINPINPDELGKQYINSLSKYTLNSQAQQIIMQTPYEIPICHLNGNINVHEGKSEICNKLINDLLKNNPGLQVSSIVSSSYYKTISVLGDKLRTQGELAQLLDIIFFFLSVIAIIIRMTRLYIDKEYFFKYEYNLSSYWNQLLWVYISFVILWIFELFFFRSCLNELSKNNALFLILFQVLGKEILIIVGFMISLSSMPNQYEFMHRENTISVVIFLIIIFFIAAELIVTAIFTTTHRKILVLTKEYQFMTC